MIKIEKSNEGLYIKFSIAGELDASNSIAIDNEIQHALEDDEVNILINCKDLAYISSAGVGVFVSNLENVKEKNGNIVFYQMSEDIFDVFKILGLDGIIDIKTSEEEAKAIFNEESF